MLESENLLIDIEKISILETAINCTLKPFDDLEIQKITDLEHNKFIIIITRKNHIYYPRNPERAREDNISNNEWSELNCVLKPIRVVISGTSLKASLQVFGVEIDHVNPVLKFIQTTEVKTEVSSDNGVAPAGVWQVSADLINNLLKKLTKYGQFRICDGFTEDELMINENSSDCESILPSGLVVINCPFFRLESPKCTKLIPHTKCKNTNICLQCKNFLKSHHVKKRTKKTNTLSDLDYDDILDGEEKPKRVRRNITENVSDMNSSNIENKDNPTCAGLVKLENLIEDALTDDD